MKLDEFQRIAVENVDKKVLLIAPPGSGKTTVLIQKIKYIINNLGVAPKKLFIITFSKSASTNIKERMKKEFIVGPFFGTLHSLSYRVLLKKKNIRIILDTEGVTLIKETLKEYSLSYEDGYRLLSLISKYRGKDDNEIKKDIEISFDFYKKVQSEYNLGKEKLNGLDFDDLMEEFLRFLKTREGKDFKKVFSHVLVDEFQDLNKIQIEILKELSEDANLFCVGDEDQCIYSFRGADTNSMVDFHNIFPGGKKLYLKYNFRSSKTIIDYANKVIVENKNRNKKVIKNFREDLSILKEIRVKNELKEVNFVIDKIKEIPKFQTIAILTRTNLEMDIFINSLIKEKIDFSILDKPFNNLNKKIFIDIINYIRASVYPKDYILKIINKPYRFNKRVMEEVKKIKYLNIRFSTKNINLDTLNFEILNLDKLTKATLKNFIEKLIFINTLKPKDSIYYIVYTLGYIEYLKTISEEYKLSLVDFLSDIDKLKEIAASFNTIEDFLNYIDTYNEIMSESFVTPKRIILGSLHSVKGMEFNNVFIANCIDGLIPHEKSRNDLEGERRLFYVGITRAKENLYLLIPNSYNNRPYNESPFLIK